MKRYFTRASSLVSDEHTPKNRTGKWGIFLLCASALTLLSFDNYILEPLHNQILMMVGDQHFSGRKFENFKALLRCKQVNKQWYHRVTRLYDKMLEQETQEIKKVWFTDWEYLTLRKKVWRVYTPIDTQKDYDAHDMQFASMIKHDKLILLHHQLTKEPSSACNHLWYHLFEGTRLLIYPLTFAIFFEVPAAQQLIAAFIKNKDELALQQQIALAQKPFFDQKGSSLIELLLLPSGELRVTKTHVLE